MDITKLKRAKKVYVGGRITEDSKKWLMDYCAKEGITVALLIEGLIEEFIKAKKDDP